MVSILATVIPRAPSGVWLTFSIARPALFRLRLLSTTTTLAVLADDIFRAREPRRLALIQLLKRHLILLHLILAPARTSSLPAAHASTTKRPMHALKPAATAHTPKHLRQDIVQIRSCATTGHSAGAALKGRHAVLVVQLALVIVAENLVGL